MIKKSAQIATILGALCTLLACDKKTSEQTPPDAATPPATPADVPRCTGPTASLKLDGVVQIGEASTSAAGIAVGVIMKSDGGTRQALVTTKDALKSFDTMDVGPTFGDAPPPKPFFSRNQLFVAYYVLKGKIRTLRVRPAGPTLIAEVDFPQGGDESFAFDVAETPGGIVAAWDEDQGDRGVVKVARGAAPPIVVSDDAADADSPKVLALDGDRVLVTWLRRRAENLDAGRDHDLERPGEDRTFRVVEYAVVDFAKTAADAGAPAVKTDGGASKTAFPIARATAEKSHVIAVEPQMVRGAPHLFVQDEGGDADGAGGRVLDVTLNVGSGNDASMLKDSRTIVAKGVGHALIDYFPTSNDSGFLSFTDAAERQMLAFVDKSGEPRASLESALESGRALAILGGTNNILALRVSDESKGVAAELVKLTCAP